MQPAGDRAMGYDGTMRMDTDAGADGAPYLTDAARWEAVRGRARAADGAFWYSVRTTGVYCRPSCGARLPRRENVGFHDSQAAARAAGFRPCLRCRPDEQDRNAAAVSAACRAIEAAVAGGAPAPDLAALAAAAGLSRFHFHRVFRAATGVTPRGYAFGLRGARMQAALDGPGRVTDAIYDAGYGSSGRFYAAAGGVLGMTPGAWRDGGRDAAIRYAIGMSSLGHVLVAATGRGICAVRLGDDPAALAEGLRARFPNAAAVSDGDAAFAALVGRVIALVDGGADDAALPLDIRGTAFQRRVWEALRAIPAGTTLTYGALAARIGAPRAVRAVGAACGANPVAVVVPCHRVVGHDGRLTGYAWGMGRKRALLAREGALDAGGPSRGTADQVSSGSPSVSTSISPPIVSSPSSRSDASSSTSSSTSSSATSTSTSPSSPGSAAAIFFGRLSSGALPAGRRGRG